MATLEVLDLRCESEGCTARPSWKVISATNRGEELYCRKHAPNALIYATKREKLEKPQAVKS